MRKKLLIAAAVIFYLIIVGFLIHKDLPRRHPTERHIDANLSIDLIPGWESASGSGLTHLKRDQPLFGEPRVPAKSFFAPMVNA